MNLSDYISSALAISNSGVIALSMREILGNAEKYLENPRRTDCYGAAYAALARAEDFYGKLSLPFEDDDKVYRQSINLKDILPHFKSLLDKILKDKDQESLEVLRRYSPKIIDLERRFWVDSILSDWQEFDNQFPDSSCSHAISVKSLLFQAHNDNSPLK